MADMIDQISEGRTFGCPYCPQSFSDINADVALAVRNNHIRRNHPFDEE